MPKNDYFVIIFNVLSYMYARLKDGKPCDMEELNEQMKKWGANIEYIRYIWYNLAKDELVDGLDISLIDNAPVNSFVIVGDIQITPKGIEYLQDNSKMKKIAETIGGVFGVAANVATFFAGV